MSEVISFRLNKDNPREAQALGILKAWCSRGYSVRYVITEALLKLNDPSQESVANNTTYELNTTLDQVKKLLEQLGSGRHLGGLKQDEESVSSTLADNFVESIQKAVKPGLKLD
jgi:hypothetical protein